MDADAIDSDDLGLTFVREVKELGSKKVIKLYVLVGKALRFLCKWILDKCSTTDVDFLTKRTSKTIIKRLQSLTENSSEKITYKEVVDRLRKVTDKEFETKLQWGVALTAEHLSYLADVICKKRVIIYNYPKELKSFYVRLNDDRCTVAAFEMVLPEVGTLITGSQNEECVNMLSAR
ncbi:hypothetical protein SLE2022_317220 [Rubroshorea leprosula]